MELEGREVCALVIDAEADEMARRGPVAPEYDNPPANE